MSGNETPETLRKYARQLAFATAWTRENVNDLLTLAAAAEALTEALRAATCDCGPRHPTDPVPLDTVPSHHNFSCGFRKAMQPVLVALVQEVPEEAHRERE